MNIKNFPEDLNHRLKVIAAISRKPLRDIVVEALTRYAESVEKPKK